MRRPARPFACSVMARSGLKAMPEAWATALIAAVLANDEASRRRSRRRAPRVARRPRPSTANWSKATVEAIVKRQRRASVPTVCMCYAAAPPGALELRSAPASTCSRQVLAPRRDRCPPAVAPPRDVLARHKLTSEAARRARRDARRRSALSNLPRLLGSFEKSKDEKVGLALVTALREPDAAARDPRRDGEADPRQVPEER